MGHQLLQQIRYAKYPQKIQEISVLFSSYAPSSWSFGTYWPHLQHHSSMVQTTKT
jgi:hypothetical protein